jgi:hypothetical protein
MITAVDVKYEALNVSKGWLLSPKVACLGAGDSTIHYTVLTKTLRGINHNGIADVEASAKLYGQNLLAFKRRQLGSFLSSVVEDASAFIEVQQQGNPQLILELAEKLAGQRLDVEVIFTGWDLNGAHIYHVGESGHEVCCDGTGFVAIGSGSRQFETQFMLSRYDRYWTFQQALLLMYSAKKRAEVSPGVGTETDLFIIGPERFVPIDAPTIKVLDDYYREWESTAEKKRNEIFERMAKFQAALGKASRKLPPKKQGK